MPFAIPVIPGAFGIDAEDSVRMSHPGIKNAKGTPTTEENIYYYHHGDQGGINKALRGEQSVSNETKKEAEKVNNLVKSSKSTRPITLHRGVSPGPHADSLLSYKPGDIHEHKGIVSTSSHRKVAELFARRKGVKGATVEYNTKPGTSMHSISNMMKKDEEEDPFQYNEHEVLLPHGSKYRVTHVDTNNRHVKMEPHKE